MSNSFNRETIIVINGGEPLKDCPTDWDEARKWQESANNNDLEDYDTPKWSWDCGFKLDFDGPLIGVSSRFYPPKTDYGDSWDGTVSLSVLGKEVSEKRFDCETLDTLKIDVDKYLKTISEKAALLFKDD